MSLVLGPDPPGGGLLRHRRCPPEGPPSGPSGSSLPGEGPRVGECGIPALSPRHLITCQLRLQLREPSPSSPVFVSSGQPLRVSVSHRATPKPPVLLTVGKSIPSITNTFPGIKEPRLLILPMHNDCKFLPSWWCRGSHSLQNARDGSGGVRPDLASPRFGKSEKRGHEFVTLTTCLSWPLYWQSAQWSRNLNRCLESLWRPP